MAMLRSPFLTMALLRGIYSDAFLMQQLFRCFCGICVIKNAVLEHGIFNGDQAAMAWRCAARLRAVITALSEALTVSWSRAAAAMR